jgi:hypothetical protein
LKLELLHPEFVSFHGEQVNDVVGGLAFGDAKTCPPDELVSLFGTKLPDFVSIPGLSDVCFNKFLLFSSCTLCEMSFLCGLEFDGFYQVIKRNEQEYCSPGLHRIRARRCT